MAFFHQENRGVGIRMNYNIQTPDDRLANLLKQLNIQTGISNKAHPDFASVSKTFHLTGKLFQIMASCTPDDIIKAFFTEHPEVALFVEMM